MLLYRVLEGYLLDLALNRLVLWDFWEVWVDVLKSIVEFFGLDEGWLLGFLFGVGGFGDVLGSCVGEELAIG